MDKSNFLNPFQGMPGGSPRQGEEGTLEEEPVIDELPPPVDTEEGSISDGLSGFREQIPAVGRFAALELPTTSFDNAEDIQTSVNRIIENGHLLAQLSQVLRTSFVGIIKKIYDKAPLILRNAPGLALIAQALMMTQQDGGLVPEDAEVLRSIFEYIGFGGTVSLGGGLVAGEIARQISRNTKDEEFKPYIAGDGQV